MRKIILFILLIVSVGSIAQTKTVLPPVGGSNTIYRFGGGVFADSVQMFPTICGYPNINMGNYLAVKRLAALVFDSCNHFFWQYDPSTGIWDTLIGGGGGGGSLQSLFGGVGMIPFVYNGSTPITADVDIAFIIDTVNSVIGNDTTIFGTAPDFIVDSIINDPVVSPVNGTKFLVGTAPTGVFIGHENQIVTYVGTTPSYQAADTGQFLQTTRPIAYYQYDGTEWVFRNKAMLIGYKNYGDNITVGTYNSSSFTIGTKNTDAFIIDTLQNIYITKFIGTPFEGYYLAPDSATGRIDTLPFRQLVAGTNITINSGARGDTINSTGGSGGISAVYAGTGLTKVNDSTLALTTPVSIANGGTNNGSLSVTAGTIYYGDGTKLVGLAAGTANQILHSGATPSWKDTTAAGTLLNGTGYVKMSGATPSYVALIPIADGGTNNASLSVTNQNLIIADGSKLIGLAKGTNGQHLIVNGSGNLAWVDTSTTAGTPNALTMNNSGSGDASGSTFNGSAARTISYNTIGAQPTLTGSQGDIPYFSASNTISNLSKNTTATRYLSNQGTSNNPSWNQVDVTNGITGVVPIANGGTNNGSLSVTNGNLLYTDGSKVVGLGVGTAGQHLVGGTLPHWVDTAVAGAGSVTGSGTATRLAFWSSSSAITSSANLYWDNTNAKLGINVGTAPVSPLHIADTATSVLRGIMVDQYNTGTNSSRITMRKARGTFASPTVIVTGDVLGRWGVQGYDGSGFSDAGAINITSTGTIGTGIVPAIMNLQTANSSGTLTTALSIDASQILTAPHYTTNGGLLYTDGSGVVSQLGAGTSTTILHGGTPPSYSAVSLTADVTGTLPSGNGGTGFSTYAKGDIIYASATNTLSKLAISATANQPLTVSSSGVPQWGTFFVSDSLVISRAGLSSLGGYNGTKINATRAIILSNPDVATSTTANLTPGLLFLSNRFTSSSVPSGWYVWGSTDSLNFGGISNVGVLPASPGISFTGQNTIRATTINTTTASFTNTTTTDLRVTTMNTGNYSLSVAPGSLITVGNSSATTYSSGTINQLKLRDNLNNSGTASAIEFTIDRTETGLGSGEQKFVKFTVGGSTEKFSVDNTGAIAMTGNLTLSTAGKGITITEGTDGRLGQTTLVAGTKAITINGLTTNSRAIVTFVSLGGTVTTTWQYKAVCTSNTLTITAIDNTGATNTLDTSILNYTVYN